MIDKIVHSSRRLLKLIGLWPIIYYELKPPWIYFIRIYNWLMYFCVTCTTVSEILYTIFNDVDLIEATECISDILGASMVVAKFTIIVWRRYDLYCLLKSASIVQSKMVVNKTDPELKILETKSHKEASTVTTIMLVLIGGTIALYNIRFLYDYLIEESSFALPYKSEYPFTWRKPIVYEILIIVNLFGGLNFICIFCAVPSLLAGLSIFACCQLEVLKLSLKRLTEIHTTEKNSHAHYLKRCIVHHQAIFRFCVHLEKIFSPCILVQFVLSGVTLSLVAFQVTLPNIEMDRKVKYMQFFFLIVGSLFVYCWYGEKISQQSKSIGNSLYNTPWYNMTKEFKYLAIQMIFRSQKPIYITAWGFINATLESYTAVLKTSVSYFALLRTFGSEDDV